MIKKTNLKTNSKNSENKNSLVETTGHSWDGIEEYGNPAPRWWLIVWVISIIWAIIYWFFYPSWPIASGNNKGLKNWSSKSELKEEQITLEKNKALYLEKFSNANFKQIESDPILMKFALAGGRAAFKENCAACHGSGSNGGKGFPNLNDDDWLYGGKIEDIYTTLLYGIRSNHKKTRSSMMPAFGMDQILTKDEIESVADYVLNLSSKENHNSKGEQIFKSQCASCHGIDGKGNREIGAPNLTDAIWLYGKNKSDVIETITYSRAGVMPSWIGRLDDNTIKQLAIYVHSLGGGE